MPHTPGPWQFYRLSGDDGLGYIRADPEDGLEIAHHGDSGRAREENEANGALIAAAPDLLAALKAMVDELSDEGDWPIFDAARAAIAKAESNT